MALGSWLRRVWSSALDEPGTPERRDLAYGVTPDRAYYMGAVFSGSQWFAENLSTVTSAVTIIARTIASLPVIVYRRTPEGRVEVEDHPVCRLIARPDGEGGILTWADVCEWWVASALLCGNGLMAIEDDGRGVPTRLKPIPWWASNPMVNPNTGRVVFKLSVSNLPWWPNFVPITISSDDCLWLRDRTDNALLGRSALSRAPQTVQAAADAHSFAQGMFSTGAKLSGVIEHPGQLSKEASERMANSWQQTHTGPHASGKVAILEEGSKFTALTMTLEDAELLASRKFQAEEIARLFNIPLPILNIWEHSTFTNSDTASQWFAQLCLASWCRKIESETSRVLFNDPTYHLELDLSALMRGSFATRIATELSMVRGGVISADEMRVAEGWPARGGDADKLVAQATGGRPLAGDTDSLPDPGARPNGSGRANGADVA